jgi:tetratricopeptide (TPR) repeat protein
MSNTLNAQIASGYQARRDGRLTDAKQLFAGALEAERDLADQANMAKALAGAGQIERDLQNGAAALQCYQQAAAIYRDLADDPRFAHTIRHVGDILLEQGAIEEARPCYEEALGIYRQQATTSPLDLANAMRGFALLREQAGEREQAKALWQEARIVYEYAGVQPGVQESDVRIARLGGPQ